jgi:hypothetical protein
MKQCVLAKIFSFGSKEHRFDKFKNEKIKIKKRVRRLVIWLLQIFFLPKDPEKVGFIAASQTRNHPHLFPEENNKHTLFHPVCCTPT